ncbi:hypothetical protein N0V93_006000 [Gnomoniopsis smithogilvyi]|uniref:Allergen Asp f 4 n=1 Tax=Gnomoniopsis smithogilvyi TaxID=1191159 RepID=A0A9W8YMG9_9PEZI|nr:hypothetical protein N0V93_006000 [Gnomoniopsis smithogilvyi]
MARLASLLLLGATAASAHAAHGHGHAHKHKRADGDQICTTIDGKYVCWTQEGDYYDGTSSSAAPTTTPAAVNVNVNVAATSSAPSTTLATSTKSASTSASTGDSSSSSSSSSGTTDTTGYFIDTYTDFGDVSCISSRATKAEIAQVGNVGGTCYGSNFFVITDSTVAAQYDNLMTFSNATEDMTCYYWNKATADGTIAGWYTSTDSYFTFTLAAGSTVYLAAEDGSQGAASCFPDSTGLLTDSNSAILGTWTEFTFVDVTTGWSAADASSIMAQDSDSTVYGLEVCTEDGATCSSIGADMSSYTNAFSAAEAALDGLGINLDGGMKININLSY